MRGAGPACLRHQAAAGGDRLRFKAREGQRKDEGKGRSPERVSLHMRVEIWSDVVCPWCYLGKRRFEHGLDAFEHSGDVEVVYRSFELDPDAPRKRRPRRFRCWPASTA